MKAKFIDMEVKIQTEDSIPDSIREKKEGWKASGKGGRSSFSCQ